MHARLILFVNACSTYAVCLPGSCIYAKTRNPIQCVRNPIRNLIHVIWLRKRTLRVTDLYTAYVSIHATQHTKWWSNQTTVGGHLVIITYVHARSFPSSLLLLLRTTIAQCSFTLASDIYRKRKHISFDGTVTHCGLCCGTYPGDSAKFTIAWV